MLGVCTTRVAYQCTIWTISKLATSPSVAKCLRKVMAPGFVVDSNLFSFHLSPWNISLNNWTNGSYNLFKNNSNWIAGNLIKVKNYRTRGSLSCSRLSARACFLGRTCLWLAVAARLFWLLSAVCQTSLDSPVIGLNLSPSLHSCKLPTRSVNTPDKTQQLQFRSGKYLQCSVQA